MNEDEAEPGRRLTPSEASIIRLWILGSVVASMAAVVLAPATGSSEDILVTSMAAATFGTGAIVIRSPAGFRAILGASALASIAILIYAVTNP